MKTIVMTFATVAALVGCGSSDDIPPKTIQEISKEIASVEKNNGSMRITLSGGSVLRTKDVLKNASMDSYRIAENLVRFFPSELEHEVIFVVKAEIVDRFGNQSIAPVFELKYRADDLKRVNFRNLYHSQLLDLADPLKYLSLAGTEIVVEWCKDEDNRDSAKRFCARNAR